MSLRFATVASGSRGNATLIDVDGTVLLVDCGLGLAELERRLLRLGTALDEIDAILLTHEHGDHIAGAGACARRARIPTLMSAGTWLTARATVGELPGLTLIPSHAPTGFEAASIEPLAVPHDAREPTQFVISDGARRLGILTDLGRITPFLVERLSGCDALLLEFNHDADMLLSGDYPAALKARISGPLGHLSNADAADFLRQIDRARLQHLVAAHLSEKNNHPDAVRRAAADALDCPLSFVRIAAQDECGPWLELN